MDMPKFCNNELSVPAGGSGPEHSFFRQVMGSQGGFFTCLLVARSVSVNELPEGAHLVKSLETGIAVVQGQRFGVSHSPALAQEAGIPLYPGRGYDSLVSAACVGARFRPGCLSRKRDHAERVTDRPMAHMKGEALTRAEARLGRPEERVWRYPIHPQEMQMVASSTRGQTRVHDVTIFIFNPAGQVALIRKHGYPPGAWRAPGGGIAPGEELIDGAVREALEETGLHVVVNRYLLRVQVTFTCGDQEQPWTTHVVTALADDPAPATQDPREIETVAWGSMTDLCGPVAEAMLVSGSGLFTYRVALHREVARLLDSGDSPADSSI